MIPRGVELFAFDAPLFRPVRFEEVERQSPQGRQIGRVSGPCAAPVFTALQLAAPDDLLEFAHGTDDAREYDVFARGPVVSMTGVRHSTS